MLVSGPQLRAARAAAALTREELAEAAGLGTMTVSRLEGEGGRLRSGLATLDALRRVLEAARVRFLEHDGMPGRLASRATFPAGMSVAWDRPGGPARGGSTLKRERAPSRQPP